MFCSKCGKQLPDGTRFCSGCGNQMSQPATPPSASPTPPPPQAPPAASSYSPPSASAPPPTAGSYSPAPGTESTAGIDYGRCFGFVFKDPDWFVKTLLLGLIMLIPIIGVIVAVGYMIQTVKNVRNSKDTPLPNIDFSYQLSVGFPYALALFVLFIAFYAIIFVCMLPFMPAMMSQGNDPSNIFGSLMANVISFPLSIIMGIYMNAALAVAVKNDNAWLILNFINVFKVIFKNLKAALIAYVLLIPIYLIGSIGVVACCIGLLVTIPVSYLMAANLIGQFSMNIDTDV